MLILAAFLAAILWIIVGGLLYLSPSVKRMYTRAAKSAAVKKWSNSGHFMIAQFASVFIQCFLFAWVYSVVKVSLSVDPFFQALSFGAIIAGVKIIPRTMKMWVHTTYPGSLLFLEFVNSAIASFGVAAIFVILV